MAALIFLLTGWLAPLPPPARAPGTIGVVCVDTPYRTDCAGPQYIHGVSIAIWVMEKTSISMRREFDYVIDCSDAELGCKMEHK